MTSSEDLNKFMLDFLKTEEDMYRRVFGLSEDWSLRELSWMKTTLFDALTDAIGEDNIRFVSGSEREDWPDGPHRRATIMISSKGQTLLGEKKEEIARQFFPVPKMVDDPVVSEKLEEFREIINGE